MRGYWSREVKEYADAMSEEELNEWLPKVAEGDRYQELFTYDGSRMTPKQLHAWADLANQFPGSLVDGNVIVRPATDQELRWMAAEKASYNKRYGDE